MSPLLSEGDSSFEEKRKTKDQTALKNGANFHI